MYLVTVETDAGSQGQDPPMWATVLNTLLLAIYSIELSLRFFANAEDRSGLLASPGPPGHTRN